MGTLLSYRDSVKKRAQIQYIVLSIVVLVIAITMVMPFVFMISMSIKPESEIFINPAKLVPDEIFLNNYKNVLTHPLYGRWYFNSFLTVILTILSRLFIVTIAAYAFARLDFKGKEVLFLFILSGMLITPNTTIIARYLILSQLKLTDSIWAIIVPNSFQVFFLFLLRQFFYRIPHDLSEAALIDGCSHFKIYYRIVLPLTVPALITMGLFTFIWTWNDFINPFIFITDPRKQLLTVGLKYFVDENTNLIATQMAGAVFGVLPPIILFMFSQKYFLNNIMSGAVKG